MSPLDEEQLVLDAARVEDVRRPGVPIEESVDVGAPAPEKDAGQLRTAREVLRDRALAASGPRDGIDDSAAAKLAARSGGAKPAKVAARPASGAASSPGPSPKR